MLRPLDKIRNIEELLTDHETPLRKRLVDAARQFAAAIAYADEWPAELQRAADRVKTRLFCYGDPEQSVARMDDAAVDETAEELLLLAKEASALVAPGTAPQG